jgi:hypothetical protein
MRVVHAIVHGFPSLSMSGLLWGVCSPSLAFYVFFAPFKGVCSLWWCMFWSAGFQLVLQASLALFWSIHYLHLIKKKKELSVPLPLPFMFSLLLSRESVPYDGACSDLLVSSLYCKLVLLFFDLYITYIWSKKRKSSQSVNPYYVWTW